MHTFYSKILNFHSCKSENFVLLKKHKYYEALFLILISILKICDFPSIVFNSDNSKEYFIFRSLGIEKLNINLLRIIYCSCDLLVYLKLRNKNYLLLTLLVPASISSFENFILICKIKILYPLLCFIDPLYFFILIEKGDSIPLIILINEFAKRNDSKKSKIEYSTVSDRKLFENEFAKRNDSKKSKIEYSTVSDRKLFDLLFTEFSSNSFTLNNLKYLYLSLYVLFKPFYLAILFSFKELFSTSYNIGYATSHLPSLSGFWYQSMCMIEQYSFFNYSMHLVNSSFLISKEERLFPLLKNNSNLVSYLPYILNSQFYSLFCTIAIVFEYLYMIFRKWEIVNTNFLYWTTLVFVLLYIFDLKQRSTIS
jgi:hypothetical protein